MKTAGFLPTEVGDHHVWTPITIDISNGRIRDAANATEQRTGLPVCPTIQDSERTPDLRLCFSTFATKP